MELVNYNILSIRKVKFKDCNIEEDFFDSLKQDYQGFEEWFSRKSEEEVYVHYDAQNNIQGFLYLKEENTTENYNNMVDPLEPKRRLKIGTFKISENGYYMGERFFKIIFDNAVRNVFDEVYVTTFSRHEFLIEFFKKFGFREKTKIRVSNEIVLVRQLSTFEKNYYQGYPILNIRDKDFYMLPIYPSYHTQLLPDAILRTETYEKYQNNNVASNTLNKVYIGKNLWRHHPNEGDILFFYRTRDDSNASPAHYQSVITSVGVISEYGSVDGLTESEFNKLIIKCVLEEREISKIRMNKRGYHFIKFIYYGKLDSRIVNLQYLRNHNEDYPRGIHLISDELGQAILADSRYSEGIVVR